jgi:hypothetical protein
MLQYLIYDQSYRGAHLACRMFRVAYPVPYHVPYPPTATCSP